MSQTDEERDRVTETVALVIGVGGAIFSVLTIAFVLREHGFGPSTASETVS